MYVIDKVINGNVHEHSILLLPIKSDVKNLYLKPYYNSRCNKDDLYLPILWNFNKIQNSEMYFITIL